MFQFYIKEKFDVKNVSIISQFKIPSCEKNATPFGFICFVYLYPWISRGKVLDNYFLIVPAVLGKCWGITLGHLPCWEFLLCRAGQRGALLSSACPHRAALIPGLWKVKPLSPPIPVGGGAEDTNDWCINDTYRSCCSSTN